MSNSLVTVNKEKVLPDERYDEKLFKQAYKAGLEAKEFEKKKSKKKKILFFSSVLLSTALLVGLSLFLLSFRKEKFEYVESALPSQQSVYSSITEDAQLKGIPLSISTNSITARSVLVFDSESGTVIFEKDSSERGSIASITKLLSVIVALESFNIDDSIEVSLENIPEDLDWTLELKEGDRIKIDYLLKAMLLSSYNDTAIVLANAYPNGGYDSFIKAMNSKAQSLRMKDSMFSNPAGLDNEMNYSTAQDVGKLVSAVLNYKYILDLSSKGSTNISWSSGEELKSQVVYTTNQLYGMNPYIKGLKTGITKDAGQCFVGYFVYPTGSQLVTVVLGSTDRFTETQTLERLSRKVLER
ncbi:MAG: hypothetical protein RBT33_01115 [Candidatus Dojkabacteria bacterium]|jgi:D-alanyl-D-alanine carboxypeptidase|nr:hypothetical protein [Candidatus Dojkabacteria bacterium]